MVKTILVRMRLEDYNKIVKTKKKPMENTLKQITGKNIEISNPKLFRIAADSVWDLGENFQDKLIGTLRINKKDLNLL